jgi:ABC-2 type transport system ATP-binding protein
MIEITKLEKSFDAVQALKGISMKIQERQVFGLVGTNGAGKSTLMRIMSGVLRQDRGEVLIDGRVVYDHPETKQELFFIPDEPWFFRNASAEEMQGYYSKIYPEFDIARCKKLIGNFGLDPKRQIETFSKGMKKQLAVILGISAGTRYLFCDETFDGLDPVMRQSVKSLLAEDMMNRGLTPVIASHNLRELEDICYHVGLLHQGGILLSEDLMDMKLGIQKVQCVFREEADAQRALEGLTVLNHQKIGRVHTITVRGDRETVENHFRGVETLLFEILPLTLEEIFISETEVAGYDIKNIILS